jgi:outer membrane protein OmpA-like peptidoglycan-associated protein
MSLGYWMLGALIVGSSLSLPAVTMAKDAPKLAQECIVAKLTTQADCEALLKKLKKGDRKQAPKDATAPASKVAPAATPMPTATPALPAPPGVTPTPVALLKDCLAVGITTQADCDALHATKKTKAGKPSQTKAPKTDRAPPVAPAASPGAPAVGSKPAAAQLAKDCIATGITTQADCDALHLRQQAKSKAKTPAAHPVAPPAPASDTASSAAASSAPVELAAPLAPKAKAPAEPAAPAVVAPVAPAPAATSLPKDCVAAGLKTQADCDALYASLKHAGKAPNTPATTPSPSAALPLQQAAVLPKGVSQQQVAPLFDSAKQGQSGAPAPKSPTAATPSAPAPTSDKAAQAAIAPAAPAPIEKQQGTAVDPNAKAAPVQLPPGATIVSQTGLNNAAPKAPGGKPMAPAANTPPANPIGLSIGIVLQIGGNQLIIYSSGRDQYRIAQGDQDKTDYERLPQQRYRETITRPDGVKVITIYDRNGDILQRSRFDRNGREIVLAYFDDAHTRDRQQWRDPGDDLPPLQLRVPVQNYVLDADQSDEGRIQLFLSQPPVETVQRLYSISEVQRSARLRDIVPRVEIGNLTFDTGSATLGSDEVGALGNVAKAMLALLHKNPAETFLIEGHTDAVGSGASNLVLSDDRAASVAQILTDAYHIPPENLATQGYGANYLKIQTDGPEVLNRRVVIRRITPLVTNVATQ